MLHTARREISNDFKLAEEKHFEKLRTERHRGPTQTDTSTDDNKGRCKAREPTRPTSIDIRIGYCINLIVDIL